MLLEVLEVVLEVLEVVLEVGRPQGTGQSLWGNVAITAGYLPASFKGPI